MVKIFLSILLLPMFASASYFSSTDIYDSSGNSLNSTSNALNVYLTNTNIAVTQSGSWSFSLTGALPAGSNSLGTVGLNAGTNAIGSITNTSFGVSSLPALAAGTNSIGTVGLNAGTNAIGSITNTSFGVSSLPALAAGSNSLGTVGLNAGTNAIGSITNTSFGVSSLPALAAGTNSIGTVGLNAGTQNIGHVDGEGTAGTPSGGVISVQGVSGGTALPVSGSFSLSGTSAVNLTQVGGSSISIGQQASSASLPVVLPAAQITTLTPPTTVTVQQTTAASLNATVVGNTAAGSGASSGLITVQGNASGTPIPTTQLRSDVAPATQNITVVDSGSTTTAGANSQTIITGTPTAGSTASFALSAAQSIEVQVTGTWTGTLESEISFDGGTTWYTRGVKQAGVAYISSTWTANFQGGANTAGVTNYRVRAIAAMTGTAVIKVIESLNTSAVLVSNPLMLKDSTTQSIGNTIKAASTAAVAADTAFVVALSPNSNSVKAAGLSVANAPVYNLYSTTNITTSAYVQLVASTTSAANYVDIFDSSGQAMILAVGASGSEVIQAYIPPGGDEFSLAIPAGSRIAYKALTGNATTGYLLLNVRN